MPGIRDDIIIKSGVLGGMFKAAKHEAAEIEKHDLLPDCKDLDKKLHDAFEPFCDTLEEVIYEMKARIDKKRGLTP